MQLAPSLHRLGSSLVNSYLVEEAGLVTIVDAGLPGYWGDLPKELAAMGRSLDDVRAGVLTQGASGRVASAKPSLGGPAVPAAVPGPVPGLPGAGGRRPAPGWGPVRIGPLPASLSYPGRRGGFATPPWTEVARSSTGAPLEA